MATCHCNVPWPYCFVAHNGLQQHSLGKFNFGLRDLPWLAKICRPMRTKISKQDRTWNITDMMGLYLLTYSMVQSPSWEANWFAASQEIPRILWNANVHYRTHKRPPSVPILCQPNPVHIPTSHLLEIHPNIIHPSTARSPQWSLSLRFPHQDPIRPPLLTHTRHMSSLSHSSRFYHPHNIGWGVQIIQLLVMQSPPFPRYLVPPNDGANLVKYDGAIFDQI